MFYTLPEQLDMQSLSITIAEKELANQMIYF